eukprot:438616_1
MWLILISTIASICTAQSNFYHSFNVANEFESSNNTFNVKSTVNTNQDETLNISFSFINGRCWNPKLSLAFEEIDFDTAEEYFIVYYPSTSDMIANCSGKYQQNCGIFSQCINNYNFTSTKFFEDGQSITIYVTKSAEVNPFCNGYSMNLNITIGCTYEQYHIWHTMRNNNLPINIYGHIVSYYNSELTILGGTTDIYPYSHTIYTKTITPYNNTNATGNSLQFYGSSWKTHADVNNNIELFCHSQCSTQIMDKLYIFGAFNTNDKIHSNLLKYQLNSPTTTWIDTTTYNSKSDLSKLTHVCVANNGTNLFIIGGYDGISASPFHNIQIYDINNDNWISTFAYLIKPRSDSGCAIVNNILYIIGGYTFNASVATNTIEILDLNTMTSQLISAVLDNTRIGHKVLVDNKHRLWIIGGRNVGQLNIPDVEIFDTKTNTMNSTNMPIKYASTISDADYSAPWYDTNNKIMFTTGGYDDRKGIITNEIQYLAVDIIGTDAYPTPPPTLPPVPTPYPTPMGHYIGLNKTFDMSGHNPSETLSFTQVIQSTEDLRTEPSFFYIDFKFINGMCSNASLSFAFEEVDFKTATTEYIDVFYPIYPVDEIAHCTGFNDFNCGTWITCINRMTLAQPILDTSDNSYNYEISVVKSAEVNNFCTYTINANLTIHCGPKPPPTLSPTPIPTIEPTTMAPTSLYTNFSRIFDMQLHMNDTVSFNISVQSDRDNSRDELFIVEFDFINGKCDNPRLTFDFEEIDFASPTEFLEIYYPTYPNDFIKQCTGTKDQNCGYFINCIDLYPLEYDFTDTLKLTILKSADVNKWCDHALNANVSITCGPMTNMPTPSPTDSANTNITHTFDLIGYTENDLISFTIPVQSQIDNGYDSIFRIEFDFINGKCHNPTLNFDFEEIDFEQSYEFIEIYSPTYPNDFIKQCTGEHDYNCGTNINCLDTYPLYLNQMNQTQNPTDSIVIYLLKSADINLFCEYSMNANITLLCGPSQPTKSPTQLPTWSPTPSPTTPIFAFMKTFDLNNMNKNKLINNYDINVHSIFDNNTDIIFNVTFTFLNGICYSPYLSVIFEEIDHAEEDEYLEIRYPSNKIYDVIARCDGNEDANCGSYEQCISFYDLYVHNISQINDEITIYVLKSAQVNNFCDNSINANITISCTKPEIICPPTPAPTNVSVIETTTNIPTNMPIMSTKTLKPTNIPTNVIETTTNQPTNMPIMSTKTLKPTNIPTNVIETTTNQPTNMPIMSTKTLKPTTITMPFPPTQRPSAGCNDANSDTNNNGNSDKLMDYLPWILFAVSGFFNVLLLIALIQQCRFRKSIEMRQRMALRNDSTQMVSMQTRAGHNNFQEIVSDNSVDYVTMIN